MATWKRDYGNGTYVVTRTTGLFSGFVAGRALCSDGRVRQLKRIALCADSFDSVPAAVTVRGKTVSGFITWARMDGFTVELPDNPHIVKFIAQRGRNKHLLPDGAYTVSSELS
jgi:hypothetical protein